MAGEKNNGGQPERIAERAVWTAPDSSSTVTYSLSVFHEIDFAVNEGYRKISHGGVEVGGLLFGVLEENGPQIDAFRPVACDHASGPSFVLSEGDVERLAAQLDAAASDPELSALKPVGWFLSRTRSPLQLLERDLALFDRFFPEPRTVTVLVKPERFQPTRFTFLVRDREGKLAPGSEPQPIILPLPGRAASSDDQPVPAIPAPLVNPPQPAEPSKPVQLPLPDIPRPPRTETPTLEARDVIAAGSTPPSAPAPPQESESEPEHLSELAVAPVPTKLAPATRLLRPNRRHLEPDTAPLLQHSPDLPDPYEQLDLLTRQKSPTTASRLFLVLPLAALLGCAVGYWGYLQLPSPIIPLRVHESSRSLTVSWPPEDTRNSVYVAIRINDASPVLLSAEQKTSGKVELSARPDLKVELIARNWMRDSRGIVRFVQAEKPPEKSTAP
ncbi:MAG TPA: hypothetical protein VH369_11980 [Bryobacteraceae bacterium]|jgi:hypothetical protein